MSANEELYLLDFSLTEALHPPTILKSRNQVDSDPLVHDAHRLSAINMVGTTAIFNSEIYEMFSTLEEPKQGKSHDKAVSEVLGPIVVASPGEKLIETNIEPSEYMLAKAADVVELILASNRIIVPAAYIQSRVFPDTKLDRQSYEEFKIALKRSDKLDYLGKGQFGIRERLTQDNYRPGQVDNEAITEYLLSTVGIIISRGLKSFQDSTLRSILKSVSGYYLSNAELTQFYNLLTAHPRIITMEDGNYRTRLPEKDRSVIETEQNQAPNRPTTSKDITFTMKAINSSPEMMRARDRATNKADTRIHGRNYRRKGSRAMGRAHGKKQVIGQSMRAIRKSARG